MPYTLGAVQLPMDVEWTDEFGWLPTAQQVDVTIGGSLIVEESKQLAGRPITLRGVFDSSPGYAVATRAVIKALYALADDPLVSPLLLTLEEGQTFNVRFRHHDGLAVEASALKHIAPHDDADLYAFTLRLMEV